MASLAQLDYCKSKNYDPEDPRCAKIFLTGRYIKVKILINFVVVSNVDFSLIAPLKSTNLVKMRCFQDIQPCNHGQKVRRKNWRQIFLRFLNFLDHHFFVAKIEIEHVGVIDYFGGVKHVKVEDYFAAKEYYQKFSFANVEVVEVTL